MYENSNGLTCRLLSASEVSYWTGQAGGLTACPLYDEVGYAAAPTILDDGRERINTVTVGTTVDGFVIVACRGTIGITAGRDGKPVILDWINALKAKPVKIPSLPDGCFAHEGFLNAVNSVKSRDGRNVFEEVAAQLKAVGDGAALYTTGHSKGGAMSYIVAAQLIGRNKMPDAIISFAAPRPGNNDLAEFLQYKMAGGEMRRYEVQNDIVPHLPSDSNLRDLLEKFFYDERGGDDKWNYESIGQLYYCDMENNLEVPKNNLSRFSISAGRVISLIDAVTKKRFKQIMLDHSLTGRYGPLICPELPYGRS